MYKTILVPLDGSKRAERILPHVKELALRFEAKMILLQIVEGSSATAIPFGVPPELYIAASEQSFRDAETYLTGLQGEFQEKGFLVKTSVESGPVVNRIIRVAENEDVDLIAMASHGHTGLARVFYGSVAAGVLHQVDRPLLLIRAENDD
jgi:nucleotide-binding universal stress UspA family protein